MYPLELILINGKLQTSSNYPLDIWAIDENGEIGNYIAKSFRILNINAYPIAKEIFACEVATHFDIPTPQYNIIDISDSKLANQYTDNEIRRFHKGYKFCSRKLDQYLEFNPFLPTNILRDYEIALIFAFDVLMQNTDRRIGSKPNLLFNDNSLVMIDHELSLSFIDETGRKTDYENNIRIFPHNNHALIKPVKSIKQKNNIFDEFFDHLYSLNISKFDTIFDQMESFNIQHGERLDYYLYLEWCKKNASVIKKYLMLMVS